MFDMIDLFHHKSFSLSLESEGDGLCGKWVGTCVCEREKETRSKKIEHDKGVLGPYIPWNVVSWRSYVTFRLYPCRYACCLCALQPARTLTFPAEWPPPQPKQPGFPWVSTWVRKKRTKKKKTMNILKLLRHIYPDLEQTGQFASRCCSSTVKVRRNLPNLI